MRAITSGEQTLFRTEGQKSRLKVYVRKPTTIYTAQVDGTPSSKDMVLQVTYKNGSGTLANVKTEMVMFVGSTSGGYDLGMARIRKTPTSTIFYIGELSDIAWVDNAYLTIVDDTFGAWPRHLVISGTTPYMDGDIAYSDQHTNYRPFVNMGTDRVVLLTGASVDVAFDASGSWAYDDTIASYSWTAPGASATSGMSTATPTITYNAKGQYRVYCTATTTTGAKSFTAARTVYVDDGTMAITCNIKSIRGSVSEGGWSFTLSAIDEVAIGDFLPLTQVILVAEDWYGTTNQSIGPIVGSENIVCIGWVVKESLEVSPEQSIDEFRVAGLQYLLKNITGFIIGIENSDGASSAWTNAKDLTVPKGLFHLLHWHSTIPYITDVTIENVTWETIEVVAPEGSLFTQLQSIIEAQLLGQVLCNRYSQLFLERDPQVVPTGDRTWPTTRTLTSVDFTSEVTINVARMSPASRIYLDGVHVSSRSSFGPLFSLSPGHTFKRFGSPEAVTNMLLNTQAQANTLAGLILGWRNNLYPETNVELTANDRMQDIAPRSYIAGTFTDTVRNITITGSFIPREVELVWTEKKGLLVTELIVEKSTTEDLSIDGDVPEGGDIPNISYPRINIPELPTLATVLPLEETTVDGPRKVVLVTSTHGVLYTVNFHEDAPTWYFMNNGMDSSRYNYINQIVKTPSGALFALVRDSAISIGFGCQWLYYCPALGATWVMLKDVTGLTGTDPKLVAVGVNPDAQEQVALMTGTSSPADGELGTFWLGDGTGLSQAASGLDSKHYIGSISCAMGKWLVLHSENSIFSPQCWSRLTLAGGIEYDSETLSLGDTAAASPQLHCFGGGIHYWWNDHGSYLRKVTDNNPAPTTTQTGVGTSQKAPWQLIACDPTGQYLVGGHAAVIGQRSSDYGTTWGNIGGGISIGYDTWHNCNHASRFMTTTTQEVLYTPDFANTWYNKSGNLSSIASLCVPEMLLYISD